MKYGLIGCGRIALNHLLAALNSNLEVVALCDLNKKNIDILLDRANIAYDIRLKIKFYDDYKKMISENKFDLVSVATSSGSHAEIALYLIQNSINTIIEKPIALSISDADKIINESNIRNVIVSVCHQNRFNVAVQELRQALDLNRFGRISHSSLAVRWNRNKNYYNQANWRGTWIDDGGALMNQCIHGIDLLRWMSLGEPISVFGYIRKTLHEYIETEDIGVAVVAFSDGAVATIEGTTNVYPSNLEEVFCLFGSNGTVKIGGTATNNIDVWKFSSEFPCDYSNQSVNEIVPNVYGNGHTLLFQDVVSSIRKNSQPYVTAQDGRNALELVLAIYKSQKTGCPVSLPLEDFSTLDMIDIFQEGHDS